MRDTIYYLIYISAGVSIFATFIVCLTLLKNSLFKNKSTLDATNINSQINACRWASVVFTVLEWFLYSCEVRWFAFLAIRNYLLSVHSWELSGSFLDLSVCCLRWCWFYARQILLRWEGSLSSEIPVSWWEEFFWHYLSSWTSDKVIYDNKIMF